MPYFFHRICLLNEFYFKIFLHFIIFTHVYTSLILQTKKSGCYRGFLKQVVQVYIDTDFKVRHAQKSCRRPLSKNLVYKRAFKNSDFRVVILQCRMNKYFSMSIFYSFWVKI